MMTDQVLDRDKSQIDLDQDRTTIERLTDRDHDKTTTETLIIGTNMDEINSQENSMLRVCTKQIYTHSIYQKI